MTTAQTIRLDKLDSRMRAVWGRGQTLHLIAGLLGFMRWAIPLFLLGVFVDWMTYMPTPGRVVILVMLLSVALYRAWRCGWRHLRAFDVVRTALQLESQQGDLNSLLVSAIQLRSQAGQQGGSAALRHHTCVLAEQAAANVRPDQAVPFKPLQKPGMLAALCAGVVVVFAAVNSPFLTAGLARIFTPWAAVQYPTNTQITLGQEQLVIKEGDQALITASLAGVIPDTATIYVRTGEGRARAIDLDTADQACTYEIASASRDFSYRIKAGDDRTAWHDVRVVPAPSIEQVKVGLSYPDYLGRDDQTLEALTLTFPEGTGLQWQIRLDREIQSARFVPDGAEPVELQVGEDARTLTFTQGVSASQGYHFTWVDKEHGFEFTSPRYFLQVASDQAPRVELTSPATNLVAMVGRPMRLAIRAQDDHGIGEAKILYRVNQHDEQVIDLPAGIKNGQGEQDTGWDYRQVLTDLQIGDTVSFAVQISDRYPQPQGPHTVRSETRRITFLSKQQYLEQIEKQKDRLLSRVQTIYRQQRSAHDVVLALTAGTDGYTQACQLEAIRQEMVRDQLKEIASQMQVLLDDLAANEVLDAAQGDALESIRARITEIAEQHVARAASLLRSQSDAAPDRAAALGGSPSAEAVNTAARELASLVLLRGIEAAQEVYAREARMLAKAQALLRWHVIRSDSTDQAQRLSQKQAELASWTDRLVKDLQDGMEYDKRPLAVLRLIRSVKDLRDAQVSEQMREAGRHVAEDRPAQASAIQAELVRTLLDAEFSVRLSGAYSTLLKTRDLIGLMTALQQQLSDRIAGLPASAFEQQRAELASVQVSLRKQLNTMLLPTIPAPRAALFDETPPQAPPIEALLDQADHAMRTALSQLTAGKQKLAADSQAQARQTLSQLLAIVDRWSVEMGLQTQGLSTLVAESSDRLSRLEEFEARVIALLEKTDIAAAEEQKVSGLMQPQRDLADELSAYIKSLKKRDQAEPDRDLPPILSRLSAAEAVLQGAAQSLEKNEADQAIERQEQAADALAEAYTIVVAQNERLSLLQDLLMFQRAVGFANGYMADIVAQQRDLLEATRASEPEAMAPMLPQFGHMRDCLEEVAPLLDLVAARLDVGTPLVFAKTDFADAIVSLEVGDKFDAVDAQDVAAESLAQVQSLVNDIQTQTGYIAEIVAFLHRSVSDTAMLQYEQEQIRNQVLTAKPDGLPRVLDKQRALLVKAKESSRKVVAATGMPVFAEPAEQMGEAVKALEAADAARAADEMELVSVMYTENAEALLAVITMLHGLPQTEVTIETIPELVRLIEVLAVASDHKQLFRESQAAPDQAMDELAERQGDLASRLDGLAKAGDPHPMLSDANAQLAAAVAAFQTPGRDRLTQSQRAADMKLRHFVIEQALILETAAEPASAEDGDPAADGPGSDSESALTAGFIADFVSGETPDDQRTEWKVLADRNRAALNQNFARELPLEYRGLLKNYYERVAK